VAGSRHVASSCVLGVVLTALAACSEEAPLADELSRYTDKGDGCQQVVSAIAYADARLKRMGQEPYQEFGDVVRSSLSAVAGTVALEVRDFPSEEALTQARRVAKVADGTAKADVSHARRVKLLREYRREAAELVIICARQVHGL